jgi:integrase
MSKVITAKLTKTYLAEQIKTTGERQTFRDATCQGLILRVGANGRMSWAYDYRDPAGKRQTYTIGTTDQYDPGQARLLVEKVRGTDPAGQKRETKVESVKAESRTLRKFLEGRYWTDHLVRAPSGKDTKKRILAAWADFLDTDMAAIDVQEVVQHRLDRLAEDLTPQTLNRDRTALLAMLNQAVEWKLIDKNPLDEPVFKPLKPDDDKRVRWLGQKDEHENIKDAAGNKVGERARFMAALAQDDTPAYLRQLAHLALNTGMRRGEMFQLRWENVSIQRAELIVRAATSRKTNKSRHITLNAAAVSVLEELAKVRHISGFVFVNPDTDKPFTTPKKSWAALVGRAKLDDFTFHDMRHDFASRLVQAGVNLYEVRDLLGHSSITLTERYAHLAPHQKRAAVALLDAA